MRRYFTLFLCHLCSIWLASTEGSQLQESWSDYGIPSCECTISELKTEEESELSDPNLTDLPMNVDVSFKQFDRKDGKYYYSLSILTGTQDGAGISSSGLYIILVGNKCYSNKIQLPSHLDKGSNSHVLIESSTDLGKILVVTLGIDNKLIDKVLSLGRTLYWYISQVRVTNEQKRWSRVFPCQHWLGSGEEISVTYATRTLEDLLTKDETARKILLHQRNSHLTKMQSEYKWKIWSETGLPSSIDDTHTNLPNDEQFERTKCIDFTEDAVEGGAKIAFQLPFLKIEDLHTYERMEDLHIYEQVATSRGRSEVRVHNAARWTTDVEFGRQMLNGVNPVVIERCTKLPDNFPVTNEMVKGVLNRGLTLQQEMDEGHVYITNLKIMDGLPTRKGQYSAAPMCLLYVNGNNQLVPIAIQLKQEPAKDNPIFLPSDKWIDWLLAKIFYQSAHAQFHQLSTHYFSCHAAMEAYAVATMRTLPDAHPINKLLRPHFRYTMAINSRARATLINDGGIIDQFFAIGGPGKVELLKRISANYSVHLTNIVKSVRARGVDDANLLPGYYYRDDGLKIWTAIETFVKEFVAEFYDSNEKVSNDAELKNWAEEIHTFAFPGEFGAKQGHGFPQHISTKEELTEYCTLIIFTGSAQHASINFQQYSMYGFVPNAPVTLRLPPPTQKRQADYVHLLKTLPNKHDASKQIFVAYLLSQYSHDEIYLGHYPNNRFSELTPHRLALRFQHHLDAIAAEILLRNENLDVPYVGMLPRMIPNSITI